MSLPSIRRSGATVAVLSALLLAAACGGDGDSAAPDDPGTDPGGSGGAGQTIEVATTEFQFDPDALTVAAGTHTMVVDNTGGMVEHDFTVDELDIQVYAAPTTTTEESVTFEAGTYDFYCSIPGHREAGMEGTLTVE